MTRENVWRRSSYCETGGCLEVKVGGDAVLIRESANPTETVITTRANLATFVAGVKRGEFDDVAATS